MKEKLYDPSLSDNVQTVVFTNKELLNKGSK